MNAGALMQLLAGSMYSAILCATAELEIAEALADGALPADEVARRCSADAGATARLLRALAALGLVQRQVDGRYRGSDELALLRADAEGSLRALALLAGEPAMMHAWEHLGDAVRTGRAGFELAHGRALFDFLDGDAGLRALFQRSLAGPDAWNRAIADALDLEGRTLAVDVGAGDGRLLAALLEAWPGLRGVAFDRPNVLDAGHAAPSLSWVGGSFFDAVPAGGDVYLLRWVLHDWPDDRALVILQRCREAVRPDGVLYVVENVVRDGDGRAALLDVSMLALTGGRERSEAEYATLLERARFRLERTTPTAAGVSILEARPV